MSKKVNLFIIGAPKCATTSLAGALAKSADIAASSPKESYFFSHDLHEKGQFRGNETAYFKKFFKSDLRNTRAKYFLDSSSQSLHSSTAIEAMLKYNEYSKFIVCVRDPVDMIVSWHGQMLVSGHESESDFLKAWELSEKRRNGENVPWSCTEAKFLDYKRFAKIGTLLKDAERKIPKDNLFVLHIDKLKSEASKSLVISEINSFLELDDELQDIPKLNEKKQFVTPLVGNIYNLCRLVKDKLPIVRNVRFGDKISDLIYKDKVMVIGKKEEQLQKVKEELTPEREILNEYK